MSIPPRPDPVYYAWTALNPHRPWPAQALGELPHNLVLVDTPERRESRLKGWSGVGRGKQLRRQFGIGS